MQANVHRQIFKKLKFKKIKLNIENMIIIIIKHLEMNQFSALDNP